MKWVYAAHFTKVMACCLCVEPVFDEKILSRQQLKPALMDLDHECVLPTADRAIARRELREIGLYLELDGTAMTTAAVGFN